jgi:NADH-quinone oxidoreductase subunit J
MTTITILHYFFLLLILLLSILVILSKNPVYSVLFLVIIFLCSSGILILFNVDFLSLLFIIIYVGAIAVLFLFVVMMLDLKVRGFSYNEIFYILLSIFLSFLFYVTIHYFSFFEMINPDFVAFYLFEKTIDSLSNIDIFGQFLYNYFVPCFLIAGIILLVAMIGAITLTLKYKSHRKNEMTSRQLSRTDSFLSFFN